MDLTVVAVLVGVITCVSSLTLDIEPKQAHIFSNTSVLIMCQADVPITTCQFKWKNHWIEGPLVDLSRGSDSFLNPTHFQGDISGYTYSGTGLRDGQCGIRLIFGRWGSRTVGCRVRTDEDGWKYADMTVSVDSLISFPLIPDSREVVAQTGEDVNLMCRAQVPLKDCTFSLPGKEVTRFNQGRQSPSTESLRYFGTGLEYGQCGATLRITDEVNGNVLCAGKTDTKRQYEVSSISITVAKPPTEIKLEMENGPFVVGDIINATCLVLGSRPPANITWFLDNVVIRQDSRDNSPRDSQWAWKNETSTVIQQLFRNVSRADDRNQLRCEAKHLALQDTLQASRILRVNNPPACGTLRSTTVDAFCFMNALSTTCESPVKVGTTAYLVCKTGFFLQPDPGYNTLTCLASGDWNRPMFGCLSDCGKRNTKGGKPLISYGDDARYGEFPWHVAFYEQVDGVMTLICGGTLISKRVVVSAAHCFWSEQYTVLKNISLYKVVAGKHYNAWDNLDDTQHQIRNVKKIAVPELYRGRQRNYGSDIAVILVTSSFDFTNFVNTACVDWENKNNRNDLRENRTGVVAGWGLTENGTQSAVLQVVELPYTSDENCINALPRDLWTVFTYDKFCAGYLNQNISVCPGDSGGGMVFKNEQDKYFLRGIVSISFAPANHTGKCFSQLFTGFTKFSEFRLWVQSFV